VSETGTTVVVVIDQVGREYEFDADDFNDEPSGYLHVMKDGKRVARFTPAYTAVYRREHLRGGLSGLAVAMPPPAPWDLPGSRATGGDAQ
jgi:hypothetical protein